MRLGQLRGLPVIDPTAARKIGIVADYQIDPAAGRLAALDIGPAQEGASERILAERIRRIGRHAVILTGDPLPEAKAPVQVNERWLDASTLLGLDVMGDDGNRVGQLTDLQLNQDTLEVEAYLLRAPVWQRFTGSRGRIRPSAVQACSRELMMVAGREVRQLRVEEAQPASLPLKGEDRLPEPSYDAQKSSETHTVALHN